jgi:hypothetical protein
LEAVSGTGQRANRTHWTPEAKSALVRPATPSAEAQLCCSLVWQELRMTSFALNRRDTRSAAVSRNSDSDAGSEPGS